MNKRLIVSPVGISLFLNNLESDETNRRQEINQHSNDNHLPDDLAQFVDKLAQRAAERLLEGTVQDRRRISAELNGLYAIYDNRLVANGDFHILIATDTALGKRAAHIIKDFLASQNIKSVDIVVPEGLNAGSLENFTSGIKDLLHQFEKIIPGYDKDGYEIIFNLTGGFKSIQGYLNIIGMFYADRLVYIFEGGKELLSIPRLPIKIDIETLSQHATELAMLAAAGVYPRTSLHLQGALLEIDSNGDAILSEWGQLIWAQIKDDLLSRSLLEFPRLEYEHSFRKEFDKADRSLKIKLQETLANVSKILDEEKGDVTRLKKDNGLQYDNYSGLSNKGTPIGHFRIGQANRVTCIHQGGKLYLRHFGSHDFTEQAEGIR